MWDVDLDDTVGDPYSCEFVWGQLLLAKVRASGYQNRPCRSSSTSMTTDFPDRGVTGAQS